MARFLYDTESLYFHAKIPCKITVSYHGLIFVLLVRVEEVMLLRLHVGIEDLKVSKPWSLHALGIISEHSTARREKKSNCRPAQQSKQAGVDWGVRSESECPLFLWVCAQLSFFR